MPSPSAVTVGQRCTHPAELLDLYPTLAELCRPPGQIVTAELVEALWRHTEGNPLYLRELAEQYDELELAGRPVLPADMMVAAWAIVQ